jgi:small GTP-binding protein
MLGDSGVGKSSLILRWTEDTFSTDLIGTVGVNFKSRRVKVDGESINAQVWDTAGQEQFHQITTSYYKSAQGIMLVFDVADKKSQDNVGYWVSKIKSHASATVKVAVIGNKIDLRHTSMECADESFGQRMSHTHNIPYFETSAKDSVNVDLAFTTLVENIVKNDGVNSARSSIMAGGYGDNESRQGSTIVRPSLSDIPADMERQGSFFRRQSVDRCLLS